MAVSRRLRYEVLRRDNHTCRYCGASAPDVKLTVDHVTPVALGGKDEASNLVTACAPCNAGKTSVAPDSPIVDDVAADALRWARARTLVLDEWREKRRELAVDLQNFAEAWDGWQYGPDDDRRGVPRDSDWAESVERWLSDGLDIGDLILLIPKAMHNKKGRGGRHIEVDARWTYYCGVVWRTLDNIGDQTKAQLDRSDDGLGEDEPVSENDFQEGFVAALTWARSVHNVDARNTCRGCGQTAFGDSDYCLHCWEDSLDPDMDWCRACMLLFHKADIDQRDPGIPRCEDCNAGDARPQMSEDPF